MDSEHWQSIKNHINIVLESVLAVTAGQGGKGRGGVFFFFKEKKKKMKKIINTKIK